MKHWLPQWGKNRPPTSRNQGTGVGGSNQRQAAESRVEINLSKTVSKQDAQHVEIDFTDHIQSAVFLDGKHVVSADEAGYIRRWRVENGTEVGRPMDAECPIRSIAVSRDGAWIISGMLDGGIIVWDAQNYDMIVGFEPEGHYDRVCVVDVSADGTRIASGSDDTTVCVWAFPSGEQLLGPLKHANGIAALKFSPDQSLIVTATSKRHSVRVYDSRDGHLLLDFPVRVNSPFNHSIAWVSDSKKLFALTKDRRINCLDISTGKIPSNWPIATKYRPKSIALASNGKFIAVSTNTTVSCWDTRTHQQIGRVVGHRTLVQDMAISPDYRIVTVEPKRITIRNLRDILPSSYHDDMLPEGETRPTTVPKAAPKHIVQPPRVYSPHENEKVANLEKAVEALGDQLLISQYEANEERDKLNETIRSLNVRDGSSGTKIAYLEKTVQELRKALTNSQRTDNREKEDLNAMIRSLSTDLYTQEMSAADLRSQLETTKRAMDEEKASLNATIESLRSSRSTRDEITNSKIGRLEQKIHDISTQLADSQQNADVLMRTIHAHEQKDECEVLYSQGRMRDAAKCFVEIASEDLRSSALLIGWHAEFTNRCIIALERIGNEARTMENYDEALDAYSAVLSLTSSSNTILIQWAKLALLRGSVSEVLSEASKFKVAEIDVRREICNVLKGEGRVIEAMECFQRYPTELRDDMNTQAKQAGPDLGLERQNLKKLEKLGDRANKHDDAIKYYSHALSLHPTNMNQIIVKCCKARAGLLEEALGDANKVIELEPSSHEGYGRKHALLHRMCRHGEAFTAFKMMLAKLEESSDPDIRNRRQRYVDATPTIQHIVQQTVRSIPRVLINTKTGYLFDRIQLAAAFEKRPIFDELRSSMIVGIDDARIRKEVKAFYRYVMLSHRWQGEEPRFQKVKDISVYDLEESSPNIKLQTFCKLACSFGFQWVWSDTCCIDQKDNVVLQESLIAMFTWYRGSSLTIIYLCDVSSRSQKPGDLRKSVWNTRAWTYQEYVAAETVQFYTEDWKPYLGLDMSNHKISPEVVSEMQLAVGDFKRELAVLRPDLGRIREKLYVASSRHTTEVEDAAYSLLGIFDASMDIRYGEGNKAVGRLLGDILIRSEDITILAWTGRSGSHNSCLPKDLTVYGELVPPYIPKPMGMVESERLVRALRSSLPDRSVAVSLYQRLRQLGSPLFASTRLRLPGIVFPVTEFLSVAQTNPNSEIRAYLMKTAALGDVEIKTADNLFGMKDLVLINPWVCPSLYPDISRRVAVGVDDNTRALQMLVRLRQPFGALLLAPARDDQDQYKRVGADCLIMVRIRGETSPGDLVRGIRTVDIL